MWCGSHLGFKNKGFKSLLVNDIDKNMIKTLLYNDKDLNENQVIIDDIKNLSKKIILEKIKEPVDVFIGGIVCKGFSLVGTQNPFDDRNYLYLEQLRLVEIIKPEVSIIENVIGLKNMYLYEKNKETIEIFKKYTQLVEENKKLNGEKSSLRKNNNNNDFNDKLNNLNEIINNNKLLMKNYLNNIDKFKYSIFDDIKNRYINIGYKVYDKVLNSYDYGSFTMRKRLIIIAVHNSITKKYEFPSPLDNNKTLNDCLKLINYNNKNDMDNISMKHSQKTISRFAFIPEGINVQDIIDQLPSDLKISAFYSRGNTMRLDRNKPIPTLVPCHSNFPIHPFENRQITIREASTIMGFPLDYKFFGSHSSKCEQIGNAVPISLAEALVQSIINLLNNKY